jgi:AraC-like DNA-binding protein
MDITALSNAVGSIFAQKNSNNIILSAQTPGLVLFESSVITEFEAAIYDPIACLILQGEKQIGIGGRSVVFGAGESLIVGHDLPVTSRITKADRKTPYRAMIITLDLEVVRSLHDQVSEETFNKSGNDVLGISQTDPALIDALGRYLTLAVKPNEAEVLGPLIMKEIHFRLLMAPHGGMLRRLLRRDSHASRVGLAIEQIRKGFRSTIAISDLAEVAGMSPSSFHDHFRSLTETTPLQFQKDLRLVEARRLLSEQSLSVSTAAFEVGYESSTQFSREYSRKFGVPPREHLGQVSTFT